MGTPRFFDTCFEREETWKCPPIISRWYYQNAAPGEGGQRPISVVLWGRVSVEVEESLQRGTPRMRPQACPGLRAGSWKSGDRLWVVEVIAPFGGHDAMVADLKAKVFPGEALKVLALVDGRKEVRVL